MPTVKELREICKTLGIKGYSKWNKEELLKNCKSEIKKLVPEKKEEIIGIPKNFKPMLANKYSGEDPKGYYVSEKLDGIRAIYDPKSDTFISRNGKKIESPKFFTKDFPKDLVLDGELYTKRGDFSGTGIFRKKKPIESEWRNAVYMVFDLPMIKDPFERRLQIMNERLSGIPFLKVVEHIKLKDAMQLQEIHNKLVSEGAEGTMLRKIGSFYENRRSNVLLKLKDFQDSEVIIIDWELGTGKYKKLLGALIVKWLDSSQGSEIFKVGTGFTDEDRENYKTLFKKGTIITISYFETDRKTGKPRFPVYKGIRGYGKVIY